jgi:hypothetical protein
LSATHFNRIHKENWSIYIKSTQHEHISNNN